MRFLAAAFLIGLLSGGASAFDRALIEREKAQTVLVTNEGFLGGGRGSGVLLDSRHVLTCAHMARGPQDELFVYTYPLGRVVRAHPQRVNFADDLLILILDEAVPVAAPPVFQATIADGEPLTLIGNALGSMKWFVSVGVVSAMERGFILTDATANPGNSGGPWFNARGEIIAITDWGIHNERAPGVVGGVSAARIKTFLRPDGTDELMKAIMGALR